MKDSTWFKLILSPAWIIVVIAIGISTEFQSNLYIGALVIWALHFVGGSIIEAIEKNGESRGR